MKYIITESRIDKIINDYITKVVGGKLKKVEDEESGFFSQWFDSNNNRVFEIDDSDEGLCLGVRVDLWVTVSRLFSLNDGYKTDSAFRNWMEKYSGEKFPGGVYTF